MKTDISQPLHIRYVKGVGPKRALAFERLGITSIRDLLYLFPRRYEDRSQFSPIAKLVLNSHVSVRGEVLAVKLKPLRRMPILEVTVGDDSGMIHAVWFNQPYLKNQFAAGQQIILFGKVEWYKDRMQITSPEYEIIEGDEAAIHAGRITPVYPLTEGLFQRSLRTTMKDILDAQLDRVISEYLPESFRTENHLMPLRDAIREMHFPNSFEEQERARQRLVYDEFLLFEITLLQKMKRLRTKYRASVLPEGERWGLAFEKSLPYRLTQSQSTALKELSRDLRDEVPMNRLLQGDVGSGKTAVAAFALLLAVKNDKQAAMLVPTEILAEQHARTVQELLAPFQARVELLTSATPSAKRERMVAELKQGKIQVLIGTHAILQEDICFKNLALVVIDEQHKFGVHQRCRLLNQNPRPHQLVMTATPIPRTLALTIYGDLAISTMRELPAGRQPIKTYWIDRKKQKEILEHIRQKARNQEQAYFIFPLIEETEKSDMLAATREYDNLRKTVFRDLKMGLIHGRMEKPERDRIMRQFRQGDLHVLVATSVIEVGVDNPNATMMVIENAERFGLSQLHQMRGRIGRGSKPAECFLFGEPATDEGKKRLRILTKTQDGFQIADEDLKLRGPGDFLGTRQSGEPLFRLAHPILDEGILLEAREKADMLVRQGRLEEDAQWAALKDFLEQHPIHY